MSGEPRRPANDITRCHDDSCPSREICSRWVYRDDGGPRTPHVATMRFGGGCEHYDFGGNPHEKDGKV